jgi:hypothetical protein
LVCRLGRGIVGTGEEEHQHFDNPSN